MNIQNCPFCGSTANIATGAGDFGYDQAAALCDNEDCRANITVVAETPRQKTPALIPKAAEKWNRRAAPTVALNSSLEEVKGLADAPPPSVCSTMRTMKTPRTDAELCFWSEQTLQDHPILRGLNGVVVRASHAQALERELTEARQAHADLTRAFELQREGWMVI